MKRYMSRISKYTFYVGIVLAIYALFKSFMARRSLPAGVCPIENNRPIMYIAIGLLIISVVLDFFDGRKSK